MKDLGELFFQYRERGIRCVPTGFGYDKNKHKIWLKCPTIPWGHIHYMDPTDAECEAWGKGLVEQKNGIAIVGGKASDLIIADFDTDAVMSIFPKSICKKVGNRYESRFYKYSGEASKKFRKRGSKVYDVELLSDGRITVIPPTIHQAKGAPYIWDGPELLKALDDLVPLDQEFLPKLYAMYGVSPSKGGNDTTGLTGIDIKDLPGILSFIPHDYWLEVQMGCKFLYGEDAWELVDAWSYTDPTPGAYNYEMNRIRWDSLVDTKEVSVRFNTVMDLASKHGYRVGKPFKQPLDVCPEAADIPTPADRYPFPGLPKELIDRMPGMCGMVMRDMYACAINKSIEMCFAGALILVGGIKTFRVVFYPTKLSPAVLIIGVCGSGAGKEGAIKYTKDILGLLKVNSSDCSDWWMDKPGSAEGFLKGLSKRERVVIIDEFGKHISDALKSGDSITGKLITMITEVSTKQHSEKKTANLVDHENKTPVICVKRPVFSLFGATVHDHLYKALGQTGQGSGFWARFLVVGGLRSQEETTLLNDVASAPSNAVVMKLQAWMDAHPAWTDKPTGTDNEAVQITIGNPEDIYVTNRQKALMKDAVARNDIVGQEIYARMRERAVQLALIVWDGHETRGPYNEDCWSFAGGIPMEHLVWACDVVEFLLRNFVEKILPGNVVGSLGARVREDIVKLLAKGPRTTRYIIKSLQDHTQAQIEESLDRLEDEGRIEKVLPKGSTETKPSTRRRGRPTEEGYRLVVTAI